MSFYRYTVAYCFVEGAVLMVVSLLCGCTWYSRNRLHSYELGSGVIAVFSVVCEPYVYDTAAADLASVLESLATQSSSATRDRVAAPYIDRAPGEHNHDTARLSIH